MKRKEQVITYVHYVITIPQTCSVNTRKSTKNLANKSGESRAVCQVFEFDNGINKITDW